MKRIFALVIIAASATLALQPVGVAAETPTLLQMIAQWQYPGSKTNGAQMSDGNTADSKGDRTIPSIICKTVMTTDATVDQVIEFYKTKLTAKPPKDDQAVDAGRSVRFSDDSEGRPFSMHTIIVNTADISTTLIITRGKDETKTHIGWKQYRRIRL